MRCEFPEYARCCFCFPLRYGLLVFAYMKLVLIGFLLTILSSFIISEIYRNGLFLKYDKSIFVMAIIFTVFFSLDIIFHLLFIISAHTKEYRKMRIFYKEAIFGLGLYIFGVLFSIAYVFTRFSLFSIYIGLMLCFFFLCLIITQGYLIILVRSEVLKLERNSNLEFTNHSLPAEEESTKIDTNNVVVY